MPALSDRPAEDAFSRWEQTLRFELFSDRPPLSLSVPDQLAVELARRIVRGTLEPGRRLGEQEVSDEFRVSRGPVREALRVLEREGLVTLQARRGAVVTELSASGVAELFEIRAALLALMVGKIANDPKVQGGAMTVQAAHKMERHVRLCTLFGLPVVNFVDQPGNQTGVEAELAGTLLGATRVGEALSECTVPWVSILIRRCFGMAGALHGPKFGAQLNHRFAWPSARWGSIPIEGGVMAAHKAEIEAAADPAAKRAELEAHYLDLTSPFRTAERFGVLEIIDPRETRSVLCDWIEDAWHVLHGDRRWGVASIPD